MLKNILLSFALALLLPVLSSAQDSTWIVQEDSVYTISHPDDWMFQAPGLYGTTFQLYNFEENEQDKFIENINLIIQDVSDRDMSMEAYIQLSTDNIVNLLLDSKILETKQMDEGGYYLIEYTGKQDGRTLLFRQHIYFIEGIAYHLTATMELNKKEMYYDLMLNMMNTLDLGF